eukprot:200370-Amphidinium_carterae.1
MIDLVLATSEKRCANFIEITNADNIYSESAITRINKTRQEMEDKHVTIDVPYDEDDFPSLDADGLQPELQAAVLIQRR